MRLITSKQFDKTYAKLPEAIKLKFKQRRSLFLEDEFHSLLNNHPLSGEFAGFRSINITGDYRAIYYYLDAETIIFVKIGTHSQLYG